MTTMKPTPPGWYVDPTGRHEHRYWDGTVWTASVSDAGVTATDAPQSGDAGAPVTHGYRAVPVPTWRVVSLYVVAAVAFVGFGFEVLASLNLSTSTSDLTRWAWLYREAPGVLLYGYPPLALWVGLVLTMVFSSALLLPPAQALKKSGLPVRWQWSAPTERARLAAGLSALGRSRTLLRGRGGLALAVLTEIAALLVVAVSTYALVAHQGVLNESGTSVRTSVGSLTVGLGPTVCLGAGLVSAVLLLVAWPWRTRQHVVVLRDGTVRDDPPTQHPRRRSATDPRLP